MSKWNRLVPYTSNAMLHYEGDVGFDYDPVTKVRTRQEIEWRPQEEFRATLKFVSWSRGMSSVYANFVDTKTKITYPVPLSSTGDFMKLLKDGEVTGVWLPVKRGKNFLLEFQLPA